MALMRPCIMAPFAGNWEKYALLNVLPENVQSLVPCLNQMDYAALKAAAKSFAKSFSFTLPKTGWWR